MTHVKLLKRIRILSLKARISELQHAYKVNGVGRIYFFNRMLELKSKLVVLNRSNTNQ